jgi:hypothetical protein
MKKIILLIAVALVLTLSLTALTWGGFDLGKMVVYGTNDDPKK